MDKKQDDKKKLILSIIVVVVILALGLFGYSRMNSNKIKSDVKVATPKGTLDFKTGITTISNEIPNGRKTELKVLAPKGTLVAEFPKALIYTVKDATITFSRYSDLTKDNKLYKLINTEYTISESVDNLLTFYLNYMKTNGYKTRDLIPIKEDQFVSGTKIVNGQTEELNILIKNINDVRKVNISIIK